MRSLLSILLVVLVSHQVIAQPKKEETDTVKVKPDYRPTGVRIGTDVISIIKSNTDKTFKGWEVNADVDFHRYYFAADYGYWARDYTSVDGSYSNKGNYFRLGADANFIFKDPEKNMFFFGIRYGHASFSEHLIAQRLDPVWGQINVDVVNTKVPANWFELTTGLRVRMWKFIWMGYTARLKFALSTGNTTDMKPSDVPGYGRADKESYWGFNYQIFVRFPVRKALLIPPKK